MNWRSISGAAAMATIFGGGLSIMAVQSRQAQLYAIVQSISTPDGGGLSMGVPLDVTQFRLSQMFNQGKLGACGASNVTAEVAVNDATSDSPGSMYTGGGKFIVPVHCVYGSVPGSAPAGGTSGAGGTRGTGGVAGAGGTKGTASAASTGGTSGGSSMPGYAWKIF